MNEHNIFGLYNCTFINSMATFGGIKLLALNEYLGVIYLLNSFNNLMISACNFSYSTAVEHGGINLLILDKS